MFALFLIFAVVAGLVFGSFLNVCISRLPRHESVVTPRSRCPHCGAPVRNRDNIPVVSWLLLRGRCRDCGAEIAMRYPLVESTCAALFLLCSLQFGFTLRGAAAAIFCWLLLGLAITDAETMVLPDVLTLPGLALGAVLSGFGRLGGFGRVTSGHFSMRAAAASLLWATCAGTLILLIRSMYWLFRRREGIGLGDAKLLAMIAAWLGPSQTALSFFVGVVSAAAYAVARLVQNRRQAGKSIATLRLPLGAFLAAGAILAVFSGDEILNWYSSFFR